MDGLGDDVLDVSTSKNYCIRHKSELAPEEV
jgi:hypothetical protein